MVVYISGRMTGIKELNAPRFRDAAMRLRDQGYVVINPSQLSERRNSDHSWAEHLVKDLAIVLGGRVEAIVVLPGWQKSKGAQLEVAAARIVGLPILSYPSLKPILGSDYHHSPY